MLRRYHRDIGLPAGVQLRPDVPRLQFSPHATSELRKDGYPTQFAPLTLSEKVQLVELWLNQDHSVYRWLFRQSLDADNDLCLVVEPTGIVVTCWTNDRTDRHKTLQRHLYATPARTLHRN